jgi:hypothetical protein
MRRLLFGFTALVALGATTIDQAAAQGVLRIA